MASVTLDVTGEAVGNEYSVRWQVTSATDAPTAIFLIDFSQNRFQGVARPSDLQYPTTRTSSAAYYRVSDVTATYASLAVANAAQATVREDTLLLLEALDAGLVAFETTTTEVLDP